jgi:hypothetical protein
LPVQVIPRFRIDDSINPVPSGTEYGKGGEGGLFYFAVEARRSAEKQSESDVLLRYYVGQCADISDRVKRYNAGIERSTRPYVPWQLIWSCEKKTRGEAMMLKKN